MQIDQQTRRLAVTVVVAAAITGLGAALLLLDNGYVSAGGAVAFGLGGFAAVLLGGGLMTAIFYSDRSGFDQ